MVVPLTLIYNTYKLANKKVGSPSSFGRKRPFMSLNSCVFIENLSSSERARVRARANPAKNDAQKGCAMQLNGITLSLGIRLKLIISSKGNKLRPSYPTGVFCASQFFFSLV